MNKVVIFGANGQLGRTLVETLKPQATLVPVTRSGMLFDNSRCGSADFQDTQSICTLLDQERPTKVINAAAYTAVDKAENASALAVQINATAPGAIAQWCASNCVPFIHYSTDYVFDGTSSTPYLTNSKVSPLGVYGSSKQAGEQAIQAAGGHSLILRTAWVYSAYGHNFLLTMLKLAQQHSTIRVVADQFGTPTSTAIIADATAHILSQPLQGYNIGHVTATGETSWHGFAEAIFTLAYERKLLNRRPEVVPISTAQYPTPARRPAYSVLDTQSTIAQFQLQLPNWHCALRTTLDTFPK